MHLLVDLQGAQSGSRHRGIGRYAKALAVALAQCSTAHKLTILLNAVFPETIDDIKEAMLASRSDCNFLVFSTPTPALGLDRSNFFRKAAGEYIREWAIRRINPDVIFITSLFEGAIDDTVITVDVSDHKIPVCVVLYDLIPLSAPDRYLSVESQNSWYREKLSQLLHSTLLFSISDFSKAEAEELIEFPGDAIIPIYSAADARFKRSSLGFEAARDLASRIGLKRPFIMHASAFEGRKNFEGLLQAFALLPEALRSKYQLVFVAAIPLEGQIRLRDIANAAGLSADEMIFAGHVNDSELVHLYSNCELFVFPSTHEGFGLPPLEAMKCGAIVLGSNVTSIPEVLGHPRALFDPHSPADIARAMEDVLTNDRLRDELRTHFDEQKQRYSWERSAEIALRAIERLPLRERDFHSEGAMELLDRIARSSHVRSATASDLIAIAYAIEQTEIAVTEAGTGGGVAPQLLDHSFAASVEIAGGTQRDFLLNSVISEAAELGESPAILILKLDHIGDFIIAFDSFKLIRDRWPKAHLTIVCGPWNRALAERCGWFDEIHVCEFMSAAGSDYDRESAMKEGLASFRNLPLAAFDLAVDFRYYDDSRILLNHVRSRYKAGFSAPNVVLDLSLPRVPETDIHAHISARTLSLAAAVVATFGKRWQTSRSVLLGGRAPIRRGAARYTIGIAPGTGNRIKAWPAERYALLAKAFSEHLDCTFVVFGGVRDRADASIVCAGLPRETYENLTGSVAIEDLPPHIAGLDLYVGNDTGTTHMSALMGVRTLCLFSGQSHDVSWRPQGPHSVTLKRAVDCSPCYLVQLSHCPHGHKCMDIRTNDVLETGLSLLGVLRDQGMKGSTSLGGSFNGFEELKVISNVFDG